MRKTAFILSLILIFFLPIEGPVDIPGFGSGAKLVGFLAMAIWLPSVLTTGRLRQLHPLHLASFGLFTWMALSILWSWDPAGTIDRIITFSQLAVLMVLIWDLYDSLEAIEIGLQAYVLGTLVAAISAVITFATDTTRNVEYATRYVAPGFDPNEFGMLLVIGIASAWYLANQCTRDHVSPFWRLINFIYIPLGAFGTLLTASRTAMIALALTGAYILFSLRARRISVRIIILVLLIGALWALQGYIPETTLSRLGETGSSLTSGDLTGRGIIWQQGMIAFSDHPILGVGIGAHRAYIPRHMVSHNVALGLAAETGIIGLALYGLVLAIVVKSLLTMASVNRRDAFFWTTIFMVWFLASLTLNWEVRKITWFLFTLIVSSSALNLVASVQSTSTPIHVQNPEPTGYALQQSRQIRSDLIAQHAVSAYDID